MEALSIANQLRSVTGPEAIDGMRIIREAKETAAPSEGASFGEILKDAVQQVDALQKQADVSIERLATGQSGNIHETLIAMQRAELSMRTLIEVRSKVINAYHEVMRMQV